CARRFSRPCCTARAWSFSPTANRLSSGRSPANPNVIWSMRAAPLLELRIVHPFYADLRCGDLSIAPMAATETLMRRLKPTLKTYRDHASVYAGLASDGTAVAAAAAPVALDFVLSVNRGDFALITDLTTIAAQLAPVFTNDGVGTADLLNLRLTTRT